MQDGGPNDGGVRHRSQPPLPLPPVVQQPRNARLNGEQGLTTVPVVRRVSAPNVDVGQLAEGEPGPSPEVPRTEQGLDGCALDAAAGGRRRDDRAAAAEPAREVGQRLGGRFVLRDARLPGGCRAGVADQQQPQRRQTSSRAGESGALGVRVTRSARTPNVTVNPVSSSNWMPSDCTRNCQSRLAGRSYVTATDGRAR